MDYTGIWTIEDLNKQGISLQETILNLEAQGYGYVLINYIKYFFDKAMGELTVKLAMENLKKI